MLLAKLDARFQGGKLLVLAIRRTCLLLQEALKEVLLLFLTSLGLAFQLAGEVRPKARYEAIKEILKDEDASRCVAASRQNGDVKSNYGTNGTAYQQNSYKIIYKYMKIFIT